MATPIPELEARLTAFRDTLDVDVVSLLELYEKENTGKGKAGRWVSTLARSGMVLLGANLENLCESLVCEAFNYLATKKVMARKYPQRFRHWLFHEDAHMRNIGIDSAKDYIELSLQLYSDVRPLEVSELKLDRIKEEFANPTVANINWLIGLFDVDDYLGGVEITVNGVNTPAAAALGELANRRNKIAHGDSSEKPSDADLDRLRKFAQLFANRLAKDVTIYTQQCLK